MKSLKKHSALAFILTLNFLNLVHGKFTNCSAEMKMN